MHSRKNLKFYTSPMESVEIFNMLKSLARASFKILKNIDKYERIRESNALFEFKIFSLCIWFNL